MIYIGTPIPSTLNEGLAVDIMQFFLDYQPSTVLVSQSEEEQRRLKTTVVDGFISGEFSQLVRNDDNIISRDALVVDIDHTNLSEQELAKSIHQRLGNIDYVLYPSLNNGFKGVRYRLVVPLDKSVSKDDYKLLMKYFCSIVLKEIVASVDESNFTFSQLQGLPILTQNNTKEKVIVWITGQSFPVDAGLKAAKETYKEKSYPKKIDYRPTNKTRTASFLDMIFNGLEEGARDSSLTKLAGWCLWHGVDNETLVQAMHVANVNSNPPLDEKDVNKIITSMIKKDVRGRRTR